MTRPTWEFWGQRPLYRNHAPQKESVSIVPICSSRGGGGAPPWGDLPHLLKPTFGHTPLYKISFLLFQWFGSWIFGAAILDPRWRLFLHFLILS